MGFQQELMKILQNLNPEKQIVLKHLQESKQNEVAVKNRYWVSFCHSVPRNLHFVISPRVKYGL